MSEKRRRLVGKVTSDTMEKSVVVEVARTKIHPLYRKVVRSTKRYLAHDEQNQAHIGDSVSMVESRPISKRKRWVVERILKTG